MLLTLALIVLLDFVVKFKRKIRVSTELRKSNGRVGHRIRRMKWGIMLLEN